MERIQSFNNKPLQWFNFDYMVYYEEKDDVFMPNLFVQFVIVNLIYLVYYHIFLCISTDFFMIFNTNCIFIRYQFVLRFFYSLDSSTLKYMVHSVYLCCMFVRFLSIHSSLFCIVCKIVNLNCSTFLKETGLSTTTSLPKTSTYDMLSYIIYYLVKKIFIYFTFEIQVFSYIFLYREDLFLF